MSSEIEDFRARVKEIIDSNPSYRRKQRDRFAVAVLGSGLMGKLDPAVAILSMFEIAELIMAESEKRYLQDVARGDHGDRA